MQKKYYGRIVFFLMGMLLPLMSASPCLAEDERIAEELKDSSPFAIPLKSALGDEAYQKAIGSGEYTYSGNLKCRLCHREFFIGRKKDLHEHTFKNSIKKNYYKEPRCLSCHTTGFGTETGFTDINETPKLANVQCEGCHGPGSKHNELGAKGGFLSGTDRTEILKKMCPVCHNSRWNKSYKDFKLAYDAYKKAEGAAARH